MPDLSVEKLKKYITIKQIQKSLTEAAAGGVHEFVRSLSKYMKNLGIYFVNACKCQFNDEMKRR